MGIFLATENPPDGEVPPITKICFGPGPCWRNISNPKKEGALEGLGAIYGVGSLQQMWKKCMIFLSISNMKK
jgi:hypothetical protein